MGQWIVYDANLQPVTSSNFRLNRTQFEPPNHRAREARPRTAGPPSDRIPRLEPLGSRDPFDGARRELEPQARGPLQERHPIGTRRPPRRRRGTNSESRRRATTTTNRPTAIRRR